MTARTPNEQRIEALEAEVVTMREALGFYADELNWKKVRHGGELATWTIIPVVQDGGRTARSALDSLCKGGGE